MRTPTEPGNGPRTKQERGTAVESRGHATTLRKLVLLGLLAFVGCTPSGPALTPVSGTITLDDKPLVGAKVTFVPQGDTQGHGGSTRTGDDGKYEITAHRANNRKGLQPGSYKVVVSRLVGSDGNLLPPDAKTADIAAIESVPARYSNARETTLSVTVDATPKAFDFPLQKK